MAKLVRLLIVGAVLCSLPWPAARLAMGRAGCGALCQSDFYTAVEQACGACAVSADGVRVDCLGKVQDGQQMCIGACPGFVGRCTITMECVNGCQAAATSNRAACNAGFPRNVRAGCREDGDLAKGRRCLAIGRSARRACVKSCRQRSRTTSTTITTTTTAPAMSPQVPSCAQCQPSCIRNIVGHCYDDCFAACEGNGPAFRLCQRACRNARCNKLRTDCVAGDNVSNAYQACCNACNPPNCAADVDCEPTTTTTTTSTTTTTTTTSSTLVGATTTTTTLP